MSEIQSDTNRIAKNSIFLVVRMAIVMIISIFTTRYLLANLGVEDYGVYNVTLGIVAMCTFLSPALSNANQRYHNFELGKNGIDGAKTVFNTGLQIQLLLVGLIVLLAETIGLWYVNVKLVVPEGRETAVFWVYQISILAFSLSMLQVPFLSAILAHERMNFYAIINVADAILKLTIAICLAFAPFDRLVFYSVLLLCVTILDLALYAVYARSHFKEVRFQDIIDKPMLKSMLSFSGWNLAETIARMGKDQGCNLLLNFYCGPVLNAARGVANQISYAFSSVVDSTVMASRPQMVANYAQGNQQTTLLMFYTLSKGTLLIVFAMAFPVYLEIDYIIKLWLGDFVPDYTIILVRISTFIILIDKLASPVTALIHATGNIMKYHLVSGIINIMVIPLAWIMLALGYGPTSVYFATLIGVVIAQAAFLFVIRGLLLFSIRTYLKMVCWPFILIVLCTIPIPTILYLSVEQGLVRLLLILVSFFVLVTLFSYYLGLTMREREILLDLIKPKNHRLTIDV